MKNIINVKKISVILTSLLMAATIVTAETPSVIFGVAPGPYGDLVKLAIKPGIEKKGYKVEIKEFSDWVQPNIALANKSIDVNVFQHSVYLQKFSTDKGLKLSPVISIPTASLGLYSKKHKAIADINTGAVITIPNDPSNLARALRFLETLGLIKLSSDIDATKASEKDIAENPKKLKFQPVEAAQLPRTLESVDFSTVPGNYAIVSGIYSEAITREILAENYIIVVAVRTEDLNKQLVKDIKEVVESKEFAEVINDPKNLFSHFQKPAWLKNQKN